ncbi:MAG: heparinase II/III family protein, partial [Planktothrix sp.]
MNYFGQIDWIQEANEVLNNGWNGRGGYGVIKLDDEIPWKLKNEQQRSWNFHIHSWDMLESLLNGYDKTHDTRFLKPAIRIAVDWVDKHSNTAANTDISPFAWYDMAVGIRANRLAHIIDAGTQSG